MRSKRVRPAGSVSLPPVLCATDRPLRFSIKTLLLGFTVVAVLCFVGGQLWLQSASLGSITDKWRAELIDAAPSPFQVVTILLVASLVPLVGVCSFFWKLPRDVAVVLVMPVAIPTMLAAIFVIRALHDAIRDYSVRVEGSLYLLLLVASLFAIASTILGLIAGTVLSLANNEDL